MIKKAKKQKTLSKYKKEFWDLFSLWIKKTYSEDGEWCKCYTCDKPIKIGTSDCQGGHCFTKKGYPGLYFNVNCVRPQCYHCNINLGGNTNVFIERLKGEIGEDAYMKMYDHRHDSVKLTKNDYIELIAEYKEKLTNL
jgi:hypothetical protein